MNKILKITFAALFVAVVGDSIYVSRQSKSLSNLVLANVEALANDEGGGRVAEKVSTTREAGPFLDSTGKTYYYIYKIVDCNGIGIIDCTHSVDVSVSYS